MQSPSLTVRKLFLGPSNGKWSSRLPSYMPRSGLGSSTDEETVAQGG